MSSLISIIIPVYNHAHTLERCLRSVERQTYRLVEVVVVNDGSTDNSKEVVEKIKLEIPIKIIEQENRGAAAARNHGFGEARGEYVIFWDADTVAKPEMLERLNMALDSNERASYAYCRFKFGWKTMKSQEFSAEDLKRYNYIDTTSLIRRQALVGLPLRPSTLAQGALSVSNERRGDIEGSFGGPFDESLKRFQDWDLWLTMLEHKKTGVFVPEILYTKIVHGRKGMSSWLPSFVYRLPWRIGRVQEYEEAKRIILDKHQITA